jgi:hypothetical protein
MREKDGEVIDLFGASLTGVGYLGNNIESIEVV